MLFRSGLDTQSPAAQTLLNTLSSLDPWCLCNGHTLIDLLSIGLQNGVLGKNPRAVADNLSSYIRGAMDKDELDQTELCRSIVAWQQHNPPYKIL